jgi:tRNA threonylcarbamoyladenosine modification (KEOPS) complex  Pcc1 subunit
VNRHPAWQALIRVHRPTAPGADRVAEALAPEVAREVPRARAEIAIIGPRDLELRITAADTSACRAALNTYLAWITLVLSTERAGRGPAEPQGSRTDALPRSA